MAAKLSPAQISMMELWQEVLQLFNEVSRNTIIPDVKRLRYEDSFEFTYEGERIKLTFDPQRSPLQVVWSETNGFADKHSVDESLKMLTELVNRLNQLLPDYSKIRPRRGWGNDGYSFGGKRRSGW